MTENTSKNIPYSLPDKAPRSDSPGSSPTERLVIASVTSVTTNKKIDA